MNLSASIVIPGYNSERTLSLCLESIYQSIEIGDEVIFVNDGSTDNTLSIANKYSCQVIDLESNRGAAFARNDGAKKAQNEILIFIDSDVVVSRDQLKKIKNYFSNNQDVQSITTNVFIHEKTNSFYTDFKNVYMNYIINQSELSVNYIYGSLCASRKKGFIQWPVEIKYIEDSVWGYTQKNEGKIIHCLKEIQPLHVKDYSFFSLLENDFQVSSSFAKTFLFHKRWNTLYTENKFGHTSKNQKISIFLVLFSVLFLSISINISIFLTLLWYLLNLNFLKKCLVEHGIVFYFKSLFWYFFDHLIFFFGIAHGVICFTSESYKLKVNQEV